LRDAMIRGTQISSSAVRWVRLFSSPALARDRGINTWKYNEPYHPPLCFEHPYQVPERPQTGPIGKELKAIVTEDYIDRGFNKPMEADASMEEMDVSEEMMNSNEDAMDEAVVDDVEEIHAEEKNVEEAEDDEELDDERLIEPGHGEVYAVVDINTRQQKVTEGALVMTDRLQLDIGDKVIFDRLLLVGSADFTIVGRPLIHGRVFATVEAHDESEKLIVFKKKTA